MLDAAFDAAIKPASAEVLNGLYTPKRLEAIVDKSQIMEVAQAFLDLTYTNSQKSLPGAIDEMLSELPGGKQWEKG
ncbi:hypothetical protein [Nostoc sp. NMS8]|uniref:hypothetical protein n=1 Tax=Nostoc sp. NMS8 TaxID=2815392 RepID=UPI0025DEABE8|nr:hypothetical protein [Nostoc sp. NMS8]MBN3957731.1 hypothetical protein [Nostoc sp. NMS8]